MHSAGLWLDLAAPPDDQTTRRIDLLSPTPFPESNDPPKGTRTDSRAADLERTVGNPVEEPPLFDLHGYPRRPRPCQLGVLCGLSAPRILLSLGSRLSPLSQPPREPVDGDGNLRLSPDVGRPGARYSADG